MRMWPRAGLQIPNLCICVTSRPEFDILDFLEPLTSCQVSLHNQSGSKQDIADYTVVCSKSEPYIRRCTCNTCANCWTGFGRYFVSWKCYVNVFHQMSDERSMNCWNLDKTYEHILKELKKPNRAHAQWVLQCLVVAI
jgi:hypothetical protein